MNDLRGIVGSMTPDQKAVYDNLFGDVEKLKREVSLCRNMYDAAVKVINDKNTGAFVRLVLKSVSDYWERRAAALIRSAKIGLTEETIREVSNAWKQKSA